MVTQTQYPAVLFLKTFFPSVPQFCFPVVNPNYELLKPHEFDLVKLRIFSSTALGGPIHGFECLWMVLGLVKRAIGPLSAVVFN